MKTIHSNLHIRQCKAIATTTKDNFFATREHLYQPDTEQSETLTLFESMKEKVRNPEEHPKQSNYSAGYDSDSYARVFSGTTRRQEYSLKHQRQCGRGKNPTTSKITSFLSELQLVSRKKVGYESVSDDREAFRKFYAEQNLYILEHTPYWHADGTFICSPTLFYY